MKTLSLTMALLFSFNLFAGEKGNGEIVIKCGEKVSLAEYYEATKLRGFREKLTMANSQEEVETQVHNAFKRLAGVSAIPSFRQELENILMNRYRSIKQKISWEDEAHHWDFSDDLGPFPTEPGCEKFNVIHYIEDDYIIGQTVLWNKLTKSEQAATYVHEVIYAMSRQETGQQTSLPARRIVTYLFSNLDNPQLLNSLVLKYLVPATERTTFIDMERGSQELILNFSKMLWLEKNSGYTVSGQVNFNSDVISSGGPSPFLKNLTDSEVYRINVDDSKLASLHYRLIIQPGQNKSINHLVGFEISSPAKRLYDFTDVLELQTQNKVNQSFNFNIVFLPASHKLFMRGLIL